MKPAALALALLALGCTRTAPAEPRALGLEVRGMTCAGCERLIEGVLAEVPGVSAVDADHVRERVTLTHDPARASEAEIIALLRAQGFEVPERD